MSADLFAQFGPSSGSSRAVSSPSGQTPAHSSQQPDDPFAFLSTALLSPTSAQQHPRQQAGPQPQPQIQTRPSRSVWDTSTAVPSQPATAAGDNDDDDTWGDFEDASPAPDLSGVPAAAIVSVTRSVSRQAFPRPPQLQPVPQQRAKTRVVRSSTIDLMTNTLIHFGDSAPSMEKPGLVVSPPPVPDQPRSARTPQKPQKPQRPANPNVLFDAEDYDGTEGPDFDDDDDDDDFGDFESVQTPASPQPHPTATALVDLLSLSDPAPAPAGLTVPRQNFQASSAQTKQPPAELLSVLSFGSTSTTPTASGKYPQPPRSPSFRERNPFPGLAVATPNGSAFPAEQVANRTPSPMTVWPNFDPASVAGGKGKGGSAAAPTADDWDAWELAESLVTPDTARCAVVSASASSASASASAWDWEAQDAAPTAPAAAVATAAAIPLPAAVARPAAKTIPDGTPPPTNVPPPSILLSAFPALLGLPDEALLRPMAGQSAEVRSRVLGDPRTIAFLRSYLQLVVVAARIVAGRKQRWHRDKFLAQSMTISAAGSSRGGGMKLAGVDRAQGQREDREAADVVAAWRRHVGKIRSAVATANAALAAVVAHEHKHQEPLRVPELPGDSIPVAVAKMVPTAPRPCVVCGLRRDERLRGIDPDDVQDSFGEWWVDHWGHRACRNFWVEHEAALRSR